MQLSNLNTYSNYKYLLLCILVFQVYIDTHASKIDNLEIQIDTPIPDSYPTRMQDLYFEDIPLKENDLNINADGASITDLNSGKTILILLIQFTLLVSTVQTIILHLSPI